MKSVLEDRFFNAAAFDLLTVLYTLRNLEAWTGGKVSGVVVSIEALARNICLDLRKSFF